MADEEQQMEVERLEVEGLQLEIGQLTEQVAQLQAGIQQRDAEIQQLMVKNEAERIHEHQKIGEKRRWREERSHQPSGCGCDSCEVQVEYKDVKIATSSLTVAAGIIAARRQRLSLEEKEVLVWAQLNESDLEDKVEAIYEFARCPKIVEYAKRFDKWQEAAEKMIEKLKNMAKPQPIELHQKTVIFMPRMERATVAVSRDACLLHIKDNDIGMIFEKYAFQKVETVIIWVWTRADVPYIDTIREVVKEKPDHVTLWVLPLPLQGTVDKIPEIVDAFGVVRKVARKGDHILDPGDLKKKNGMTLTAMVDGGPRMRTEDLWNYIKNVKAALPEAKWLDLFKEPNAKDHHRN